jgi:hypothetical protein
MPTDRNVPTLFQRLAPFFPLVVQRGGVVDDSSSPRWAQSWPAVVPTYVDIVGSKAALRNRTDAVRHRYLASRLLKDWAPWLEKASLQSASGSFSHICFSALILISVKQRNNRPIRSQHQWTLAFGLQLSMVAASIKLNVVAQATLAP